MDKTIETFENALAADPAYQLWSFLHGTSDVMTRAREKEIARYGIPIQQVATIFIIHTYHDQATPTLIARLLFRRPHTISSILDRMEKDGLIEKQHDRKRKNVIRVTLTEKGEQTYQASLDRSTIHRIIGRLTGDEQKRLRTYLEKLREGALHELSGTPEEG